MASEHRIRDEFIGQYCHQHSEMRANSWNLIAGRDDELRALNKEFGYPEADGSFGISCKTHVDKKYKARYEEIEVRFRKPYDQVLPAFYDWCRSEGMTIYEYLLLEEIDHTHLKIMADEISRDRLSSDHVSVKARLLVDKLKAKYNFGELREQLRMIISYQSFANARCRKFFWIRPWHIMEQKAIFDYQRRWRHSLWRTFDALNAA